MKIKEDMSLDDFMAFLDNGLPQVKMKQVKRGLLVRGEADEVFHCLMADYNCNQEYIESLIGTDDEKNEENNLGKCQNLEETDSIETKQINNNQLNKFIMKAKEQDLQNLGLPQNFEVVMNAVKNYRKYVEKLMNDGAPDYEAAARRGLMAGFDLSEEKAEEIICQLKEGIKLFDDNYAAFRDGHIVDHVNQLLENKNDEEKKKMLAATLASMELVQQDEEQLTEEDIQKVLAGYEEKTIDQLVVELEEQLQKGSCFDGVIDYMAASRQQLDKEQLDALREVLRKKSDDYKFCTALLLYMLQADKTIDLSMRGNGVEMDPKTIGACAAAAVAIQEVNVNCDGNTWRERIKLILGVLFMILAAVAYSMLLMALTLFILSGLMMLFGQSILAIIIASIVSLVVPLVLSKKMEKVLEMVMEEVIEKLDAAYEWVADKVVAWFGKLKAYLARLKEWAVNKVKQEQQLKVATDAIKNSEERKEGKKEKGIKKEGEPSYA